MQEKKIILLAGPTASGKSDLAILLANHYGGEIINADSMQVYKEISILTSKPKLEDLKNITHHLYGFISAKKKFSTGDWLRLSLKKIEEIWKKGNIPIIVGGSGLYFKALIDGLIKIPNIPDSLRLEISKMHKKIGQKSFFEHLIKLDPLAEKFVSPTDTQRSMRVFEVKKFTNKSLFELIKETKSNFNSNVFKKIFIDTPKNLLHKKIETRVEKMFKEDVTKEVERFLNMNIYRELSANKIIGIKEIKDYLQGKVKLADTKELIAQKTRQYAKRQFTWSRGHMKSWNMIYSTNINELFKKAINKIS
tara:strand:- start:35 stop:955 length:921 start_codon:yes stop_codon:yes gene_type:complete